MLTDTEWAYLAGFFDGDGCVNIATRQQREAISPQHYLQVIFSQCDRPCLEYWHEKVQRGRVYEGQKPEIDGHKILYQWRLTDRDAEAILLGMLPYLRVKKEEAEIALRFQRTKHERAGRNGVPPMVVRLRECYKQMLHEAKHSEPEPPPLVEQYERIANSQLSLL